MRILLCGFVFHVASTCSLGSFSGGAFDQHPINVQICLSAWNVLLCLLPCAWSVQCVFCRFIYSLINSVLDSSACSLPLRCDQFSQIKYLIELFINKSSLICWILTGAPCWQHFTFSYLHRITWVYILHVCAEIL